MFSVHLDFNTHNAEHRQAADWLAAQPDPAEAVVRLIRAANEGKRRLQQWEELASLLARDLRQVLAQMGDEQPGPPPPASLPEVREDPESARRLDSLFR